MSAGARWNFLRAKILRSTSHSLSVFYCPVSYTGVHALFIRERRKDMPHKTAHWLSKAKEVGIWFGIPMGSVVYYAEDYREKEKLHHRF